MQKEEISYWLKYLNFISSNEFSSGLLDFALEGLNSNADIPAYNNVSEIIDTCNDEMLKIAIVRNANDIELTGDGLIQYKKKKYRFNNVFNGDSQRNDTVISILEFVEKRIRAGKNSNILLYANSGSGKTTLMFEILDQMSKSCSYSLQEIYLNKLYSYKNGLKVLTPEIEKFVSHDVCNIVRNFATKKSNGVNTSSSRSHVILTLYYTNCEIKFVDCAGCEKYNNRELKEETKAINSSLFCLSNYLKNPTKFYDKKDILSKILKTANNLITVFMLTDNGVSYAGNILTQFQSLF